MLRISSLSWLLRRENGVTSKLHIKSCRTVVVIFQEPVMLNVTRMSKLHSKSLPGEVPTYLVSPVKSYTQQNTYSYNNLLLQ